jgi:hypothetical protein
MVVLIVASPIEVTTSAAAKALVVHAIVPTRSGIEAPTSGRSIVSGSRWSILWQDLKRILGRTCEYHGVLARAGLIAGHGLYLMLGGRRCLGGGEL